MFLAFKAGIRVNVIFSVHGSIPMQRISSTMSCLRAGGRRSIKVFPYFYIPIPAQVLQSKLLHLFYCQNDSPST